MLAFAVVGNVDKLVWVKYNETTKIQNCMTKNEENKKGNTKVKAAVCSLQRWSVNWSEKSIKQSEDNVACHGERG